MASSSAAAPSSVPLLASSSSRSAEATNFRAQKFEAPPFMPWALIATSFTSPAAMLLASAASCSGPGLHEDRRRSPAAARRRRPCCSMASARFITLSMAGEFVRHVEFSCPPGHAPCAARLPHADVHGRYPWRIGAAAAGVEEKARIPRRRRGIPCAGTAGTGALPARRWQPSSSFRARRWRAPPSSRAVAGFRRGAFFGDGRRGGLVAARRGPPVRPGASPLRRGLAFRACLAPAFGAGLRGGLATAGRRRAGAPWPRRSPPPASSAGRAGAAAAGAGVARSRR